MIKLDNRILEKKRALWRRTITFKWKSSALRPPAVFFSYSQHAFKHTTIWKGVCFERCTSESVAHQHVRACWKYCKMKRVYILMSNTIFKSYQNNADYVTKVVIQNAFWYIFPLNWTNLSWSCFSFAIIERVLSEKSGHGRMQGIYESASYLTTHWEFLLSPPWSMS